MTQARTFEPLAPGAVSLICPSCRQALGFAPEACFCAGCQEAFPVVDGIPLFFNPADRARYRMSSNTAQEYYRNVSKDYGRSHHVNMPGAQRFLAEYETRLKPYLAPQGKLLEIGSGTGFATGIISRHVEAPVVTDASLEMLAENRNQHPHLTAICCATENLPFSDNSFDLVVGNNTFYLVPDKQAAAQSIARVLRKGGRLILSEMNPYHPLWPVMFTIKRRFFERTVYEIFPRQMAKRFGQADMVLEDYDFYSYTPYFASERLLRWLRRFQSIVGGTRALRRFTAIRIWYVIRKKG
jgi:ubiquinone/menaquinone biosynthesis C-methylase UbiE